MTTTVGCDEFKHMMAGAVAAIKANHERLSTLDSAVGDGDHGVTMLRAAAHAEDAITQAASADLKSLVFDIGWALLNLDGGATGPLLGSLFMGMSEGITTDPLDGPGLASMFEAGLVAVRQQTKAQVGDKTMMDALVPAVEALRRTADEERSIEAMLSAAAAAAEAGAVATKDMVARFGRSRNLGERTLGTPDPGATSMALLFHGFYVGLAQPVPAAL